MQCPDCGYEVDDAVVFCPQCRYQFREAQESGCQEIQTEDPLFEDKPTGFSEKELRQLEVQLLQPALFLVVVVSAGLYLLISPLQLFTIYLSGLSIALGAGLSFLIGIAAGLLFFFLARQSIRKFRS
jgi:hypothetical protein